MKRAVIAGVLWYVALWNAGGAAQFFFGVPVLVGMTAGVVVAVAIVASAWRRRRLATSRQARRVAAIRIYNHGQRGDVPVEHTGAAVAGAELTELAEV